ncbi:nickel pincer cofactor biosynthesis protein LarB [Starkeya koreensis]|uniref:Nickel pincer cofactor biosynthesis protein LarB n=1 Tax=Ancylobacter koreensis TaxID=266121 RepID=A0ABT0DH42_9HYPH|nr:nickel pincer cofactor biosynthesis protein LarB [Ancylobacter koreensis]MCK0206593.1 nickel pincer cofactor biosynthesis protein LarB [Ancylobacter koreensis]
MEFEFDWQRAARTGVPEAVLCAAKSAAQIGFIVGEARARGTRLLLTRLEPEAFAALDGETRYSLDYDPLSRSAVLGGDVPTEAGAVAIVAAGTSDLPVAREAARTLAFSGHEALLIADVGVAGLWRLMARIEEICACRVVIAVAGMEGALFSVLGGLVSAPVIAVPSSVGYGVAEGGRAALHSALASCAPGVVTVNIDNGFGAACAAIKMLGIPRG